MKKIIIFILFTKLFIFASTEIVSAKYDIRYGGFLPLGSANTSLKTDGKTYEIIMEAKATGLAKALTNGREEIYKSSGKVLNKQFIPEKFVKIKKNKFKYRIRTFTFNTKEKIIEVNDKEETKKTTYEENFKKVIKVVKKEENTKLDYYASQDILSLFFNLKNSLLKFEKDKIYENKAVGANKTKGIISFILPKNKIEELKSKDGEHLIAYINEKIFQSERGELFLSLNKDGFCDTAILKDVLFFGDIVGKIVKFNKKD